MLRSSPARFPIPSTAPAAAPEHKLLHHQPRRDLWRRIVPHLSPRPSGYGAFLAPTPSPRHQYIKHLEVAFALDTGGFPSPGAGGRDDLKEEDNTSDAAGRTRLEILVRAAGKQFSEKLNHARKNIPMKIFLLLLGFYTANALATILGQTGDWDVLVAGVVVAATEGIGMLMYRKPMSASKGRMQSLVGMVNFWKAGVCLGLFVDAFKLGS